MEAKNISSDKTSDPEEEVAPSSGGMSHHECMKLVHERLKAVIGSDPLLSDLPELVTVEEVQSHIALEYGQAMSIQVRRADGAIYAVIVQQNATVLDLKKAIERHVTLKLSREHGNPDISWRYVWRTYWLSYDGTRLTDNHKKLRDYSIRNKDEVVFVKRLHGK